MTKPTAHNFTLGGERITLTPGKVERACRKAEPDPIRSHYAVIEGRNFPPKQAVFLASGVDRLRYPTAEALRVLRTLGFPLGRQ